MLWVVIPFDQRYEAYPAVAVSTTLPPSQNSMGPLAVITGATGIGLTVTARVEVLPLPQVF